MTVASQLNYLKDNRKVGSWAVIFFCYKKQTEWQTQANRSESDLAK